MYTNSMGLKEPLVTFCKLHKPVNMLKKIIVLGFLLGIAPTVWAQGFSTPFGTQPEIAISTDCSSFIADGKLCWDSDNDLLYVGNGTTAALVDITSGADTPYTTTSTVTDSIRWNAAGTAGDGVYCGYANLVQINSGPYQYSIICQDSDSSTIYGNTVMRDGWNAGTITFELEYVQTAADTGPLNSDITCACRGPGETINSTWGTEIAIDDAAVTGSSGVDHTTSAAVTCNGPCAAGDTLYWRWQMDAAGTTTAVATLNILGVKAEYTAMLGD